MALPCVTDYLKDALPQVDEYLIENGVSLLERPIQAAMTLARDAVEEVIVDETPFVPNFGGPAFLGEPWFRAFYSLVEEWYKDRYGDAFESNKSRRALGFVIVWSSPFAFRVPLTAISVDRSARRALVTFAESIQEGEDPLSWIVDGPNIAGMTGKERARLEAQVRKTGALLRSVRYAMTALGKLHSVEGGLMKSLRAHLDGASQQIVSNWQEGGVGKAAWELQMACECALKLLAQKKTGSFIETHDLFILFDEMAEELPRAKRNLLKRLPRHKVMTELRYGLGKAPTLCEFSRMYLAVLEIVRAALDPLLVTELQTVTVTVRRAPWTEPITQAERRGR